MTKLFPYMVIAVCLFTGCRRPTVQLEGKDCDEAGRCAPGYICYPPTSSCVRELPTSCEGSSVGTCPNQIFTGGVCSEIGAVLPCSTTANGCDAGCRRCEDGQWSGCSGSLPAPTGETGFTGPTGTLVDPRVTTLSVTSGENSLVTITFVLPSDVLACTVRRTMGTVAANAGDGTAVGNEITAAPVSVQDLSLTNGTTYFYTAFCRSSAAYRSVTVTIGENAAQATPIGLVQNLSATVTSGPAVSLSYTKPSGAVACLVRRNTGAPPSLNAGTDVAPEQTASTGSVTDMRADTGSTYQYAVYCRVDPDYRNDATEAGQNLVTVAVAGGCLGTFTVSKTAQVAGDPKQCAAITAGQDDITIARFTMVSGACPSHLTGLTLRVHPSSNTDFINVRRTLNAARIGEDSNTNGLLDDSELITTGSITNDTLNFTAFSHAFAANESRRFIIEVDARVNSNFMEQGFFAAQITSASDVRLSEMNMTRALSPAPLVFDAHAVTFSTCASKLMSPMSSVRSFELAASIPLNLIAPDTLTTEDQIDTYCNAHDGRCDDDGSETSNCQANDNNADDLAIRSDAMGTGATVSRYLKINTELPYGLPVCRVALEVQASLHAGSDACDASGALFHWSGTAFSPPTFEAPLHYIHRYQSPTEVAGPVGPFIDVRNPAIFTAATTAGNGGECMHMTVTHNLTALYANAATLATDAKTSTFTVRMMADQSTGLHDAATASVRNASEVHLYIDEP